MQNVTNKVILITGASSGIGESTARILAANGAKVVLGARRLEKLEMIAADIRKDGGVAEIFMLDVTDRANTKAFVDFAIETFGRVDVLFNNAGIMPLAPMDSLKFDEWDNMIDINVRGVLNGIGAVLPAMKKQGGGQIINTASIGAHLVSPTAAVYCGTKHMVWAISEGLRQERDDIRVTIISPGVTTTELGHDITDDTAAGFLTELRKKSLDADAIARSVLFAVSQPDDVDVNEIIVRATASSY